MSNKKRLQEREKLDKFVLTYLRCFDQKDTKRMRRLNNLNSFFRTLGRGPISLGISVTFPFYWFYGSWFELPFIYQAPFCGLAFVASRELFAQISLRYEYRVKRKLYDKYKKQMDLTREEVEAIEFEEQLKLPDK
mmetsp:Transcript_23462/g.41598  ORF Transcript_23462/g.41598 Transcript_23462/m.41598 type:complete len:135 (-) Transcript_23462:647-1051(-)